MLQLIRHRPTLLFLLTLGIPVVLLCWLYLANRDNRDALWNIVSQQCMVHYDAGQGPAPCIQVDEEKGVVVFKDRNGPLQYLLMPTMKVTGIESPLLLDASTPNYFEQAWQARHFMSDKQGSLVPDSDISLTVNSPYGRTQDHLHIHISCLLPEVKTQLLHHSDLFSANWQSLPGGLLGHDYSVKRITATELHQEGAFRILANGIPGAKQKMDRYGLAMVALANGDFLLMATERRLLKFNHASAEEIQDHQCRVLFPSNVQ